MNEQEQAELNKQRDAARTQALHSLADRVIGKDPKTGEMSGGKSGDSDYGRVKIWHLHDEKFIKVWPVDASEMIASGQALLDKPEPEPDAEL